MTDIPITPARAGARLLPASLPVLAAAPSVLAGPDAPAHGDTAPDATAPDATAPGATAADATAPDATAAK